MFPPFARQARSLTAEILDELPSDHPDAVKSRRDLRVFNAAMGNWRWMESTIPGLLRPGERVLEIGAGTGELGRRMTARGVAWDGLDRAPQPPGWPGGRTWHQTDVFTFSDWPRYQAIVGNLVFHHFSAEQLATLGSAMRTHARVIVIGDLRRGRLQQWLFMGLALAVGANRVSRHDGWVSIQAGFRGDELASLLGLDPAQWTWRIAFSQVSAYRFVAERRS